MLFYLGFLSALFLVLIYANYTLYITNKNLSSGNFQIIKSNSELTMRFNKLQDDVTTLRMKR